MVIVYFLLSMLSGHMSVPKWTPEVATEADCLPCEEGYTTGKAMLLCVVRMVTMVITIINYPIEMKTSILANHLQPDSLL